MIGLDTNLLVRYLTHDDAAQYRAVMHLLARKGAGFFVPDLVLVEVDWVLTSLYQWTAVEVAETFSRLLTIHNLAFENEDRLRAALHAALHAVLRGADLSDELIAARCQEAGCAKLATFDQALAKHHGAFAFVPKAT
jgi:predicted nucleic-acid-binding protein